VNDPVVPRKKGVSVVPFVGDLLALSRLVRDRGAGFWWRFLAVAVIAYVVSPVDAIPEVIAPVIAWVDDVGLVLAVRLLLDRRLARYRYPLFGKAPDADDDAARTIGVREVRTATSS
jgi:uncharacterized membrane protein YkvA (DUF1232 family)